MHRFKYENTWYGSYIRNHLLLMQAPMIPTYGASGSNAGPSIGVTDRNAPSVTIVSPVSYLS